MATTISAQALPGLPVLEQTPMILEKMLSGASDEQMNWKPSAERWSISEVLAHLTDVESAVFRERVRKMLDGENPAIESYDQNEAYEAGKYSGAKPRDNLKKFCHERDRSLSWLRYVSPAMISRSGQHAVLGKISIANVLNAWACHDLGHIRQVAEIYRAQVFYPHMGPIQRYYTVKP